MTAVVDLEHKDLLAGWAPADDWEFKSGLALLDAPAPADRTMAPADATTGAPPREITAVVAVTGVRDEVGDTITPGAFAETLAARPRPKVCLGHDWNRPIGKTREIKELLPGDPGLPKTTHDGKPWPAHAGALIATYIPDDTKDGWDAYNSAKFYGKQEATYSIGYKTRAFRPDPEAARFLDKLDLFEYGPVLIPAHPMATLQDWKSGVDPGDVEVKVKQVRDTAYWGLPYGTPITEHTHPHGPKARAERRAGRVPSRDAGTMDSAAPAPARGAGAATSAHVAGEGLFSEPESGARVTAHPTRAKGHDQQHIDTLASEIGQGNADEDASEDLRGNIDKAIRGLLDEGITPAEVHQRLSTHPAIRADAGQRGHQEGEPGPFDHQINEVAQDYAARYVARAKAQQAGRQRIPADRFTGMSDQALIAHRDAAQSMLSDMDGAGIGPNDKARAVARANHAGAQGELDRRTQAATPAALSAHQQGRALRDFGSPQEAEQRADQMQGILDKLIKRHARKPPAPGSPEARLPAQMRGVIAGLRGEPAPGSTSRDESANLDEVATPAKPKAPPVKPTEPARTVGQMTDTELAQQQEQAKRDAFRGGNTSAGDRARTRLAEIQAETGRRADAAARTVPAHPLSHEQYRAARDRAMNARFQVERQARENAQVDKTNAAIDKAEQIAANAPERITDVPAGAELVGGGRLLLHNGNKAGFELRTADNMTVMRGQSAFTHPSSTGNTTGKAARLKRGQILDLADRIANITDVHGNRIPTTHPDSKEWARGFRDNEGRTGNNAIAHVVQGFAADNGLHPSGAFAAEHIRAEGRPTRTDVADEHGFYPRQHVDDLNPGDEVRLPDGSVHTLDHVQSTLVPGSGYTRKEDRQFDKTLHFTGGGKHEMGRYHRQVDARYAGGVGPGDASRTNYPGMGFTPEPLGAAPGQLDRVQRERNAADLEGTPAPGTRFIDSSTSSSFPELNEERPRVGRITDRVANVEGRTGRVVEYDDGTFDAITAQGLKRVKANPSQEEINAARAQWGLPPEGAPPASSAGGAASATGAAPSPADAVVRADTAAQRRTVVRGLSDDDLRAADTDLTGRAAALGKAGQVSKPHQMIKDEITRRSGAPATTARPRVTPQPARPTAGERPYEVVRSSGSRATVRFQGNEYQVQRTGGVLAGVTVTAPNGEQTHVRGGSTTMARNQRAADTERAVREALNQAHTKLTASPGPTTPAAEATAVRADARPDVSPAQPAALHTEPDLSQPSPPMPDTATQPQVNLTPQDLDELAQARDTTLGITEHDDGHLEVEPEVANRQDRVANLLDRHSTGSLDLGAATTPELHGHRKDLADELRLQQELARRPGAAREPAAPRAPKPPREEPTVRPGLAGAAQDHAEALTSGDAEAIERTRARLESSLRRSRAGSESARAIADHVAAGGADADNLNTLATRLREEARARRNAAARKRRTARRLDRERIQSLLGSVDAELRSRGESPELASVGAPTPTVPTRRVGEAAQRAEGAAPGGPAAVGAARAAVPNETTPTPLTDQEYQAHIAHIESAINKAMAAGQSTDVAHTIGGDGVAWTPQRARAHKDIVDSIWNAKGAHVPREHKAIMSGGLGGAGKSTVLAKHAGVDQSKYFTLNPDDVKEEMVRRGMVPKVEGLSPMEASSLIHEESSHIANQLAQRAYNHGTNVIWDITMSRRGSVEKRLEEMAAHGYNNPQGVFVDIPVETSVQRALSRHRRGMERYRNGEGEGGRYVPPEIIRKAAHSTKSSANRDVFDQLVHRFTGGHAVFDNSRFGQEPRKLEGSGPWAQAHRRELPDGLQAVNSTDSPAERESKLFDSFRWLTDHPDHKRADAVRAATRDAGAPTFISDGAPIEHTEVAAHWPTVRQGTEHIPEPLVQIQSLAGAGGNEHTDRLGVAGKYHANVANLIQLDTRALRDHGSSDSAHGGGFFSDTGGSQHRRTILHHEYGHHLAAQLSPQQREAMFRELGAALENKDRSTFGAPAKPGTAAQIGHGLTPAEWVAQNKQLITNHVGTYASTNDRELEAELWGSYRLARNPQEAARIVGRYLSGGTS